MQTAEQALEGKWTEEDRGYETPCWIWQRAKMKAGYGETCVDGEVVYAHRVAYELFVGPIPDGLVLDHLCRVRECLNPAHLEPVTDMENRRRGGTVKLTEDQVREIKRRYRPGQPGRPSRHRVIDRGTAAELAEEFGVAVATVKAIARGYRWAEVVP
jgi:hypothetical protein